MSIMASQITGNHIICSTACSGQQQRKLQGSASLALCERNLSMDSPQKGVTYLKIGCGWILKIDCIKQGTSLVVSVLANRVTFAIAGMTIFTDLRSKIQLIPWLLRTWPFALPDHQQPWHWPYGINGFCMTGDFKYLCHLCKYIFMFPQNNRGLIHFKISTPSH